MGFDITRFQRKYKEAVAENAAYREQIAAFEAEKAQVVRDAVAAAVAPLHAELAARSTTIQHQERKLAVAETEKQLLADRISCLEAELGEANKEVDALIADRDSWKAKYDAHAPEIEEAKRTAEDAIAVLKQHEAKMARREREALAALENRKALAAAVPGRNRRA